VQNVNRRPKKKTKGTYEINGIFKTKSEWCIEYGIWQATVDYRMKKMGMSLEQALKAEKLREGNHSPKLLDIQKDRKKALEDLNKINSYIECNLYIAFCRATNNYELMPQYKILNYKADFLVKDTNLVIECDGYDQHKTKEQIASDYKRERDIINDGYSVIRFSGSEINRNADLCVEEILKRLSKLNIQNTDRAM
jgi:very-short-patch-repair endonuclease